MVSLKFIAVLAIQQTRQDAPLVLIIRAVYRSHDSVVYPRIPQSLLANKNMRKGRHNYHGIPPMRGLMNYLGFHERLLFYASQMSYISSEIVNDFF